MPTTADEFVKRRPGAPGAALAVEAAGLRWLAAAGGVRVCAVRDVRPDELVLERIAPVAPSAADAAEFGRALAHTQAAGAPHHGAGPPGVEGDGWIAALPLPLTGAPQPWGPWFAEQRVEPFLRAARDAGAVDAAGARTVGAVCERLAAEDEALVVGGAAPARLHGDLWSGNVVWSGAGAVLVDCAAHGGHRETDLAMLALFGLPHLDVVLDAYDEAAGTPAGRADRVPLHQLDPLLVHAVLFGGAYGAQAVDAARRSLAL
ncbi:fructosamine kinase family protein [Kineococcus siccus]|uniref:fructosamine kinase family protein n=1 Tax=Kineococcus siccus TaxID=2696567 RepID=UPI0030B80D5B